MRTFTTPLATYEIKTVSERRVTDFTNGQPVWENTTTYRIFKDGRLTTVCYDEADIVGVIDCQENPDYYAGMNSRFD